MTSSSTRSGQRWMEGSLSAPVDWCWPITLRRRPTRWLWAKRKTRFRDWLLMNNELKSTPIENWAWIGDTLQEATSSYISCAGIIKCTIIKWINNPPLDIYNVKVLEQVHRGIWMKKQAITVLDGNVNDILDCITIIMINSTFSIQSLCTDCDSFPAAITNTVDATY